MPAGLYNFLAEQGATLQRTILYTDSNDVATNLTGYTAAMQVRPSASSATVLLTATTENGRITLGGAAGTIDIDVDASTMEAMTISDSTPVIEIAETTSTITIFDGRGFPGETGKTGPQGSKGDPGGPVAYLDDLIDVLTISPADGDVLKYSSSLLTWTNTNRLDGGNF